MGYFDGIVEQHFAKEDQFAVFYPWGIFGRGRVLETSEKEQEIRKFVKRYKTTEWVIMMVGIMISVIWGFNFFEFKEPFDMFEGSAGIVVMALILQPVSTLLWIYFLRAYKIQDLKISTKRLSFFQSLENASSSYGPSTLTLMMALCVFLVAMGLFGLFSFVADGELNWVNGIALFLSTILFGFIFYLWSYMFAKNKKD